ncbi:hypothetical protein FQN54_008366 [Arachnomyces sp. PD_36]|nr:hypothetical protein FQN54_008366 [Arachnomyces sp. PD_36]
MATEKLIGSDLLGSNVNLIKNSHVFDLNQVVWLGSERSIVVLNGQRTETIPGLRTKVNIAEGVGIRSFGLRTTSDDTVVKTGSELIDTLKVNASARVGYFGVSVDAGASYSYEKSAKRDSMYGLLAIDQKQFYTYLKADQKKDLYGNLNQEFVKDGKNLPDWEESQEDVQNTYRRFFEDWGTHVIKKCLYGTRYSVLIESENSSTENKTNFKAHINAEYTNIFSANVSADSSNEFKSYRSKRQTHCSVIGGDRESANNLQKNPNDKALYEAWTKTLNNAENSSIVHVEVDALGDFLEHSDELEHRQLGAKLITALKFFTKGPTSERIIIPGYMSGWAKARYINPQAWGNNLRTFRLRTLNHENEAEKHEKPNVYTLRSHGPSDIMPNYACAVELETMTGEEVTFGIWAPHCFYSMVIRLFPPGVKGSITVGFHHSGEKWKTVTIPNVLAAGSYSSDGSNFLNAEIW